MDDLEYPFYEYHILVPSRGRGMVRSGSIVLNINWPYSRIVKELRDKGVLRRDVRTSDVKISGQVRQIDIEEADTGLPVLRLIQQIPGRR
jgi:hypothetical protein